MDQIASLEQEFDAPELERRVSYRVSRLHARLNTQAARILKDSANISLSQWRIMVMIDEDGEISASEIVRRTKIDKAMVSRGIKSLAAEGLVDVVVSQKDQRLHNVRFTKAGRARFEKAFPHMIERQRGIVSSLTTAEKDILFELFEKIENSVREMESASEGE
ncbi:MAG: MarR family transcriptional regulator [Pseudomonadota bacterium]